mmetsp:Transcript_16693/g.46639  ORF Transcript_16693/g.46639 Transcript_16693/m.46639 type:complete len:147 (+) Transcript_16693:271-711(+)
MDEGVKAVQPFLQRAEEVAKFDLKVAYYCRLYSVEFAMSSKTMTPGLKELLGSVMGQLEKDKPQLDLSNPLADQEHLEAFAVNVFNRADKVDRAGRADVSTAKSFYAASVFLEVRLRCAPLSRSPWRCLHVLPGPSAASHNILHRS